MTKETTPNSTSVKLESYRGFMKSNEYRNSTIREYQKYIYKILSSVFYEGCNLKSQIQIFVKEENEHHPLTIKTCRAAIYSFYKMETGNIFHSCNNSLPCSPEIELMLKGFYEYTCSVKHLTLTTATQEVSHVKPEDTYWYLTATPELLSTAVSKFEMRCGVGGSDEERI